MRQTIMFLLVFVFGFTGTVIYFTPSEFALNRQGIAILFFLAFLSALWGILHRCKCDCNGKCDCKK